MPRFYGLGPEGKGPLTGRGEGYCAVEETETGAARGVVGLENRPFLANWFDTLTRPFGLGRRGGRRRGAGRGRGRR